MSSKVLTDMLPDPILHDEAELGFTCLGICESIQEILSIHSEVLKLCIPSDGIKVDDKSLSFCVKSEFVDWKSTRETGKIVLKNLQPNTRATISERSVAESDSQFSSATT